MRKTQAGSVFLVAVLLSVSLSIIGLIGWHLYDAHHSTNTSAAPTYAPSQQRKPDSCGNEGVIIVQFGASTSDQQMSIISEEHATVKQSYSSLPGLYALNITKGKEQSAINDFKAHSEVQAASLDHCNYTNSL